MSESEDRSRWEWPVEEIRRVGYQTVDLIAKHLTDLPGEAVFRPFPPETAAKYEGSSPPTGPASTDEILKTFVEEIEPFPFGNGHPRFFGWVNSPPVIIGIFAEALAAAMNPSCAGGNHAAIYVEREVINWFKQLTGFPTEAMGLLVSGGSMAALTALAVARHAKCGFDVRAEGLQDAPSSLTFYQTDQGHACHQKAIELLGVGHQRLRIVDRDDALRMKPAALEAAIREDKRRGQRPIAVVASVGTVNTGAIDPLDEIADICAEHDVWLHVDGAYGAPAILSNQYSSRLSAISRADSLALDPHKWLSVPVEAGLVLVRDADAMRSTFSLVPPYLRTDGQAGGVTGPPWFSEYGYQQTRGFNALKVWMAMKFHGVTGYQASIERDIELARILADALRDADDFEVYEPTGLSIVCFRYRPLQHANMAAAVDRLNQRVLERVQLEGRVFLSGTSLDGRFWLRACIINPRSRESDVLMVCDVVRELGERFANAAGFRAEP